MNIKRTKKKPLQHPITHRVDNIQKTKPREHGKYRKYSVVVLLITPSLTGEDTRMVTRIKSKTKTNFRFFCHVYTFLYRSCSLCAEVFL